MSKTEEFITQIINGYQPKGEYLILGGAMLNGEAIPDTHVKIPLKTMNRHGLIAGATGTGKTKTLQVISEQLSEKGVPVLVMDIKGDLSGIAKPGVEKSFITERHAKINLPYSVKGFPVELMSLSQQDGIRMRATVSEFGPVLFSRILDLNTTQASILSTIFKYCDDNKMALLDLKDIKKVIQFITDEGKEDFESEYGKISASSTGVILRKIIELEQQDADLFFGEISFDIDDLMRADRKGNGYINIIRLDDIQDKPKLFSTFMLCLLAEVYDQMPEKGDAEKPELVIFIDEAHLIFKQASKTLLEQIETIVKLIRSKGVGIFFVTQNPMDVPNSVLAQLGLKVQHALRAFTATDRKAIKLTAENFPISDYYQTDEVLTSLGTGEALVTALNEKGRPTPLAVTMIRAPMSRMDILTPKELTAINTASDLVKKYNKTVDRESAYEILSKKIEIIEKEQKKEVERKKKETEKKQTSKSSSNRSRKSTKSVTKVLTSATFIRGALGILKKVIR
ncbi:MAG: DUF853 family protein [Candidatus Lokiarchaeota archaeon]|nr:DUF853 family protein [Candidatus Lokiarchaeota archaeon]